MTFGPGDIRWHVVVDKHGRKTSPELQVWSEDCGWEPVPVVEEKDFDETGELTGYEEYL